MKRMSSYLKKCLTLSLSVVVVGGFATQAQQGDPKLTEVYSPVPPVVSPGKNCGDAPSDAIILFDGRNLDAWRSVKDTTAPAGWTVADGVLTVVKKAGNIETRQSFMDYQLHIEWRIPENITGSDRPEAIAGYFWHLWDRETRDTNCRSWIHTTMIPTSTACLLYTSPSPRD